MRVLSGTQPSGDYLHIGNYFGALQQYVALQEEHEALYFIADYHSMNTVRDAKLRREYTRSVALDYLACGLDPARAVLFRQTDVPEVCELAWLLSTVTPMGLLERGHAYKDKIAQGQSADHGLFAYPVLMAADILLYHADLVPVGQDQKQHIEMTRDIAARFNHTYGDDVLKLPEPFILEDVAVVPGTDGRKMSKSYDNAIAMFALGEGDQEGRDGHRDRLDAGRGSEGHEDAPLPALVAVRDRRGARASCSSARARAGSATAR